MCGKGATDGALISPPGSAYNAIRQENCGIEEVTEKSVNVRQAVEADLGAVYEICLKTGDAGRDAEHLFEDPKLVGHVYGAPYLVLEGCISFVAEDEAGVLGYAVGAPDTRSYEKILVSEWLPDLRSRYPLPGGPSDDWSPDEHYCDLIHNPRPIPEEIVREFPAHIHMNLLQRARGRGVGSALLEAWVEAARQEQVRAVHAGVSATNLAGLKFWTSRGFTSVREDFSRGKRSTIWCGRML